MPHGPGTWMRRVVRRLVHGRLQRDVDRMAAHVDVEITHRAGGAYDAFSHAYGSARLTLRLGSRVAGWLGELNERLGSEAAGKHLEAEMDRANNAVGRAIGRELRGSHERSEESTARLVLRALDEGRLKVIRPDPSGVDRLVASSSSRADG